MATSWGSTKQQFLWQLHQRVGHPLASPSGVTPFTFEVSGIWNHIHRGDLWRNIDQLEAVVEFYANFTEPWGAGAAPLKPGDPGYKTVSLRDPTGQKATVAGNVVTLDGSPDLSDIIPDPPGNKPAGTAAGGSPPSKGSYPAQMMYLYDTLWLEADTGRSPKTYRITNVDDKNKTVTLDAAPKLPQGINVSKWRLNRRPIIVIIDPIGPRVRTGDVTLQGAAATVKGADPNNAAWTVLSLDGSPDLGRVNVGFDTIRLDTDTSSASGRPGPVYRIVDVNDAADQVTVAGAPSLGGGSSGWQIPAGVGGVPPTLNYDLGPQYAPKPPQGTTWTPQQLSEQATRGYDHYDAGLFLVHRGKVVSQRLYRWSSYTSRIYGSWDGSSWKQDLSSVRGNARYYYSSYFSGNPTANPPSGAFKNFTFAVVDYTATPPSTKLIADTHDHVAQARFYTGTPTPPANAATTADPDRLSPDVFVDANGKTSIRLHLGSRKGKYGSGSAGCMVSPEYIDMRTDLLKLFEADYGEYFGMGTFDAGVRQVTNATTLAQSETLWKTFNRSNWDGKVVGTLWLIRPDERPI